MMKKIIIHHLHICMVAQSCLIALKVKESSWEGVIGVDSGFNQAKVSPLNRTKYGMSHEIIY